MSIVLKMNETTLIVQESVESEIEFLLLKILQRIKSTFEALLCKRENNTVTYGENER